MVFDIVRGGVIALSIKPFRDLIDDLVADGPGRGSRTKRLFV